MATRARTDLCDCDCDKCKLMEVIIRMEDGSMITYYMMENDYWRWQRILRKRQWFDFLLVLGLLFVAGIFTLSDESTINESKPSSPRKDLLPVFLDVVTFVIDNFPFQITGFIIFLLTGLGYLPMIYWMGKLLKTNIHLKQEGEKLVFEKNKVNLNEIKKLNLELKKKDNLNSTLNEYILNLDSQKSKLRLQLQKTDKLNSKLELQNNDLQLKVDKKTKQNVILKSEKVKLQSEKQEIKVKLKEAKKLNVVLERTGAQLESQNEKVKSQNQELKLELEREKDQRLCDVCADNFKNMLLLPCKHFSLCKTCLNFKKWSKCPICRQNIESTIDVHVYG